MPFFFVSRATARVARTIYGGSRAIASITSISVMEEPLGTNNEDKGGPQRQ